MKKLLIGVSTVGIGLIVIASIVLEFLNWNQFKPQIAQQVFKTTGRQLQIKGDLKLRLLPSPKVIVHDIELANDKRSDNPQMVFIKHVKVGIALLPLFLKEIKITKIILDSPLLNIEKFPEGGNWMFSPVQIEEDDSIEKTEKAKESSSEGGAFAVAVDHAEIINGSLQYKDQAAITKLDDIQLEMSMGSLKGPYAIKGSLSVNNEPYKIDIKTDQFTEGQLAPVTLSLSQKLGNLTFLGKVDPFNKSAQGTFNGHVTAQENLTFNGTLVASEKELNITNLSIQAGDHKGQGEILLTLQPALAVSVNLSDLPGGTFIKVNAQPQSSGAQGKASIQSQNLFKLLQAFGITVNQFQKQSTVKYSSDFKYTKTGGIELDNLVFQLNNSTISGFLKAAEEKVGYKTDMDLKVSNLDNLLALADVHSKRKFGSAHLKGTLSGSPTHLKVNQTYSFLNADLAVEGTITNPATNLAFNLVVKAHHPNLAQLLEDSSKPSQRLSFSTKAKGSLHQVELSSLTLNLGSLSASGQVTYGMGDRTLIKANISINNGNILQVLGGAKSVKTSNDSSKSSSQKSSGNTNRWSQGPINLSMLKTTDLDIHLKAPDLSLEKLPVKNAVLSVKLRNGEFTLNKKAQVAGGNLTAQVTAKITDSIAASVQMNLENVSLQQLGTSLADYKDLEGRGSLQFLGKTQGKSEYELISNLSGDAKVSTSDAVLKGWDMKSLSQSLGSLQGLTKSLTFDQMMGKVKDKNSKQTKFTVTSTFNAHKGIITTNDFKIVGDGLKADGKGHVNLPTWTMDAKADVFLTDIDDKLGVPAYARGPLDNLSYGMQTAQLMQYVYTKFLKGTLEKVLNLKKSGNPLGKLLGLGSKNAPQPNSTETSPSPAEGETPSSSQDELGKTVGNVLGKLLGN